MNSLEVDALINRIEARFSKRPVRLRVRTALLVALGYAGFLFWFLLLAMIGSSLFFAGVTLDFDGVVVLVAIGAVLLTIGIFQAIQFAWIPMALDKSRVLSPDEAPILFECLDRIRAQTGAVKLYRVTATCDFNAGVWDVPRLGFFGWPRHHLSIGLPLLEALSPPEAVAVLAHEMAHLSARHSSFGMWIYRLQRTWGRLFDEFRNPAQSKTGRAMGSLVHAMMNWYWPRLHAHLFVLSRSNEFVADRMSADCTSPEQAGSALWKIACVGQRIEQTFWPDVWRRATTEPTPPQNIMLELAAFLERPPLVDDATRWCEQAAQRLTDRTDTHPSFAERAKALGLSSQEFLARGFPSTSTPNAAELLLGDALAGIRRDVSARWLTESQGNWQGRYGYAALVQRQLTAIEPSTPSSDLAPEVLWDKAQKVLSLEGPEGAEPLLRQLVALRPTHSAANLILGKHLLDRLNAEGASHLQRILDLEDDALIPQACSTLTEYFQAVGHAEGAQTVRQRLQRYISEGAEARKERAQVGPRDAFRAHELAAAELNELTATLRAETNLDGAWLVQKQLVYFPRQRLFVLSVRTPKKAWGRSNAARDAELVNRLIPKLKLPGRTLVISLSGPFRKLAKRVISATDSQII
jgi:Zn-dependent protease with chaperone function